MSDNKDLGGPFKKPKSLEFPKTFSGAVESIRKMMDANLSESEDGISSQMVDASKELTQTKTKVASLARIREVIFGMQDGLISSLVLVSSVYGATQNTGVTVIAGLAGAFGGTVSMSAGSFLSSKAEREVHEAQINLELQQFQDDPGSTIEQLIAILMQDGLSYRGALVIAEAMAEKDEILLRTVIEKKLGLSIDMVTEPWKDAFVMGISFFIGAFIPIIPYLVSDNPKILAFSIAFTGLSLFTMGVGKSRLTKKNPIISGLDILSIGILAGLAGYFFGTVLPGIFGIL